MEKVNSFRRSLTGCQRQQTKLMDVRFRTKGDASCVVWSKILHAPGIYVGSENKVKLSKMEEKCVTKQKNLCQSTQVVCLWFRTVLICTQLGAYPWNVSVWSLCPFAENSELKDCLVSVRLLFHSFYCVWEARVQKSSVVRFTQL